MKNIKFNLKAFILLAIFCFGIIAVPAIVKSTMTNYCSIPPFVGNVITPNVLIMLDNSGSMNDQAYAGTYDPTKFSTGQYYGYFDPAKNYKYTANNRWEVTAEAMTNGTTANPITSGNFLNWATMRRVDVAKKLLIGGKASPRSPEGAVTVKLYGENSSTAWNFSKDFNNTSVPNLVYPFTGNYRYSMSGDQLSITPLVAGTQTENRYPTIDIANGAWTPNSGTTRWTQVDEVTADADTTYIQNTTSNSNDQVILGYDKSVFSISGTITNVTVVVRAKKAGTSTSGTRRIQGVIRVKDISGVDADFISNYSNLSTSYSNYNFSWATNPQTGLAWTWNDLTTSGINSLTGFGVKAYTAPTSTNYPRVTQIYMIVTVSNPSGGPYNLIVDQGGTKAEGIIDRLSTSVRFGLAYYAGSSGDNGGKVDTYVGFGSTTSMITSISNMSPDTWTPLAETLYEMTRYFRQDSPNYSNSPADYQTGLNYDPYYYNYSDPNQMDQYVPCAKSFVLFLTDGESTHDQDIPGTGSGACSLTNITGCSSGYRFAGTTVGTTYPSSGTDYLIDAAFWARTNDMRPGTCTTVPTTWQQCLPGTQNVTLYSVYMFGRGSTLLKDAAIDGGFNDINGNNRPDCNTNPAECYKDSDGDGTIESNGQDDPLTYYEGDDGYELEISITKAIADILRRAASGTAVSVLTTSTRGVGSVLQAYFLPVRQDGLREVSWTGYVQNIWIDPQDNLREDTTNDYQLILDQDKAMKLYFNSSSGETEAGLFTTEVDGTGGTLSACSGAEIKPFSEIKSLWEAGKKLATDKSPSARTLFSSTKVMRGVATTHTFTPGTCGDFSANCFTVSDVTGNATLSAALNPDATYTSENIVRYIRGECLETGMTGDAACTSTPNTTYRDRRVTVDSSSYVWKLGDIISSTPKVIGGTPLNTYHIDYADTTYFDYITSDTYKKKSSIAFVGANDGMIHAFRVGYLKDTGLAASIKGLFKNFFSSADTENDRLGEEIWGYIPFNAFPYLKYLADPTYCHIYYADLSIRVVDASIGGNPTDARTSNNWKTVLIGGMRFGGACGTGGTPADPPTGTPVNVGYSAYFAIDITNPENPVTLWEFSDDDMGYGVGYPSIIRTGDKDQNGNWYVAFGSGSKVLPKSATDIGRGSTGYIYILNLKTGELVKKIALDHNAVVGDVLAIDANKDYRAEKIYFGTAYYSAGWKGKLMSIAIPNQDLSSAWTPSITPLFSGNYPFTASPDATKDINGNVWVYAGAGKYYSDVDRIDTSNQIFFGLMDKSSVTYPVLENSLYNATNVQTIGTVTGTTTVCTYDSATNAFANKTVVTYINRTSAAVSSADPGWIVYLTGGERVISRPLAVGGLVDFLSYKPDPEICKYGGNTYLYSLGYTTGVAPVNVAIRAPGATSGTTGEVTVYQKISLGAGSPPTGEAIIIPPPKEGKEELKKKIQIATGVIVEAENRPAISVISKIMHWLKK